MVLFLDTNILIDFLSNREPFAKAAKEILNLTTNEDYKLVISTQSILDVFYVARKDCQNEKIRAFFIDISEVVDFIGADKNIVLNALRNNDFSDFEDCVQAECASQIFADYIITRNENDFVNSKIPAISPEDFLEKYAIKNV